MLLRLLSTPVFQSLEDVIQLRCHVKDKDKSEAKTYSYTQLKELQSKLTLVAGEHQNENKDTIQRFDAVSDQKATTMKINVQHVICGIVYSSQLISHLGLKPGVEIDILTAYFN